MWAEYPVHECVLAGRGRRFIKRHVALLSLADQTGFDPHPVAELIQCDMTSQQCPIGGRGLECDDETARRNHAGHWQRNEADMRAYIHDTFAAAAGFDTGRETFIVPTAPAGEIAEREMRIKQERPVGTDALP